jgi:hypothetical protein
MCGRCAVVRRASEYDVRVRRVCFVVCMLIAGSAAAETAAELFDQGLKLLDAGHPLEACQKLEAAVKLEPEAPGILLNLGLCHERLHHVATALKWFRKAQTRSAEHGQLEAEAAAKQHTAELAANVPTIKVELVGAPPDAAVTIDGSAVEPTSFARIEIDAGKHEVVLAAATIQRDRQTIDVRDDARDQVVTLHARPLPHITYVDVDRGATARHHAYVVGGIGSGLLLAETGLGLAGRKIFDDAHSVATRQRWKNIVRYGGTATFGLGCVAIATAIVMYVRAPGTERIEQHAIVPVAGPDGIGAALVGQF